MHLRQTTSRSRGTLTFSRGGGPGLRQVTCWCVRVADGVDLHYVRVPQPRHRLRLALESLPLVRPGVRAGQRHLEGDDAVEAQMPGPEDDAHAPVAEHRLDLVARYLGQRRFILRRRREAPARPGHAREPGVEFGP